MNAKLERDRKWLRARCNQLSTSDALVEVGLMLANPHSPEAHTVLVEMQDTLHRQLDCYAREKRGTVEPSSEYDRAAIDAENRNAALAIAHSHGFYPDH